MPEKKYDLEQIARQDMRQRGLQPDYPKEALQQLESIKQPAVWSSKVKDLRNLLWCSIDNDDSRDLDQLTYAKMDSDGKATLWVAIADVDALVKKNSPIDQHAQMNTTSIYTPAKIFSMLPEKLSTNLTSLNEKEDRVAMVVEMKMTMEGHVVDSSIYQAAVHNYAQLSYSKVGAWLEKKGSIPDKTAQVKGLQEALQCQHTLAQILKNMRHEMGALSLETAEAEAKWRKDSGIQLEVQQHNFAHEIIENFMIAANSTIANFFVKSKIASLRRVVRIPKRWDRIVNLAYENGESLPDTPNSKALDSFLCKMRKKDPVAFPDLSLSVIKMLGNGEYIVEKPGDNPTGHFGLALREYSHSTAPNRRYPDIITQRQLKAYLESRAMDYDLSELEILAGHCTQQEDSATKVERQVNKSAAAMLLEPSIGAIFNGIVTGASDKGTFIRILNPPVEGKIVRGSENLDVGDRTRARLVSVDVPRGYIDFVAVK